MSETYKRSPYDEFGEEPTKDELRLALAQAQAENARLRQELDHLHDRLANSVPLSEHDQLRTENTKNLDALVDEVEKNARLRAALEDCKHFLLQMKQETLGPLFGMANYKHEAERLYDRARQALGERSRSPSQFLLAARAAGVPGTEKTPMPKTRDVSNTPGEPIYVTVTETDIPGLVDVVTQDGERFNDLTLGQLRSLMMERGWVIRP